MTIDFLQRGELEDLPRFITSLAVGLLIGLERERSPARLFHPGRDAGHRHHHAALLQVRVARHHPETQPTRPDFDAAVRGTFFHYSADIARQEFRSADTVTAIGLGIMSNIGFKLGLVFFIGGPPLPKRCALGMIVTAAGIGLALLLSAR